MGLFSPEKKTKEVREETMQVGDRTFKVFIYLENRYDCRASIGQKGVHIRLSRQMRSEERLHQEIQLKDWAKGYIAKNELHKKTPKHRQYHDGDTLNIMNREFMIRVHYIKKKNASNGELKNGVIKLFLSEGMTAAQEQKHKTYLVSRLIGNEFQPEIAQRVQVLNDIHFKRPIKRLRLRDNVSNWGSCSWDGNINISVRLLFAPPEVIDYILIHELAHLVEHNHSDRFWRLVEKAMPGYRLAEEWLHKNGERCLF